MPKDINIPWLDPMPEPGERHFAQDLRGIAAGRKAGEVPEWKRETFNKTTSFGKVTSLSIQEQRKNLPIYQMRSLLIQAITEVCRNNSSFLTIFFLSTIILIIYFNF